MWWCVMPLISGQTFDLIATQLPAQAGCWVVASEQLAGADDHYNLRAVTRLPATAGCWL